MTDDDYDLYWPAVLFGLVVGVLIAGGLIWLIVFAIGRWS